MPQKFSESDAGCIFDGYFGQSFNDERVIRLAFQHGYDYKELLAEYGEDSTMWPTLAQLIEWSDTDITEDAVDYLNTHAVSDGVYFAWVDGDFMLVLEEEEQES